MATNALPKELKMGKILFYSILFFIGNCYAFTIDSINFDDTTNIEGKNLILNGVGIRKATFLRIKVYYGALYLTEKSHDQNTFLKTTDPKKIVMHFVRDVSKEDLKKTYKLAFLGANKDSYIPMLPMFENFNEQFHDMKKGQRMTFTFLVDGVILSTPQKTFQKIGDEQFSRGLLNMWFINPLDKDLTKSLLGH